MGYTTTWYPCNFLIRFANGPKFSAPKKLTIYIFHIYSEKEHKWNFHSIWNLYLSWFSTPRFFRLLFIQIEYSKQYFHWFVPQIKHFPVSNECLSSTYIHPWAGLASLSRKMYFSYKRKINSVLVFDFIFQAFRFKYKYAFESYVKK